MPNYSKEKVGQILCYIKNNAGNLLHNNKKWTLDVFPSPIKKKISENSKLFM